MAIKIIKHGEKIFKITCPICSCEFTYQADDLKEDTFKNHYIECPDCKQIISHAYEVKNKSLEKDLISYPYTIWTNNIPDWPDCDTCPNKPDPTKIVVGDTPCTWCKKNQPYCTTTYCTTIKGETK